MRCNSHMRLDRFRRLATPGLSFRHVASVFDIKSADETINCIITISNNEFVSLSIDRSHLIAVNIQINRIGRHQFERKNAQDLSTTHNYYHKRTISMI